VALAFLNAGYQVVLTGRHREPLEGTVAAAGQNSSNAVVIPADVTDPGSVHRLFAEAFKHFGRLDVLFNNAGISGSAASVEEVSFPEWSSVMATNLTGSFLCTQEAFRIMKSQRPRGGRIINNGSLSAHVPRPHSAAYTASKHAITGLTRATSLDGREHDIACGQIDIGNARTELAEHLIAAAVASGRTPEPTIDVQCVAHAVLEMASLPLDTNILFMTIMATKMPYVGRG